MKFLLILLFSFQGIASEKIKVFIIDTGVDLSHEEISKHVKDQNDIVDYKDSIGHGTSMAGLILKDTCDEVELISCNYYYPGAINHIETSNYCFKRALTENIQYINYSSSGPVSDPEEKEILQQIDDKGIIITIAAGNSGKNLINDKTDECDGAFPACYLLKNSYIVQNINKYGELHTSSNYISHASARSEMGVHVPVLEPDKKTGYVTGTSPAAAKHMNRLLLQKCKELEKR